MKLARPRFGGAGVMTNSEMGVKELKKFALLSEKVKDILNSMLRQTGFVRPRLTSRPHIKLSPALIADLDNAENIEENHILEALAI